MDILYLLSIEYMQSTSQNENICMSCCIYEVTSMEKLK